jgi:hypothetical protein
MLAPDGLAGLESPGLAAIVTKSAKGVYQNHICLHPPHLPKICLADKAK